MMLVVVFVVVISAVSRWMLLLPLAADGAFFASGFSSSSSAAYRVARPQISRNNGLFADASGNSVPFLSLKNIITTAYVNDDSHEQQQQQERRDADVKMTTNNSDDNHNNDNRRRLGLLRGVDPTMDDFYADEIDMSKEGLAWLDQPGLMWEAAKRDAAEKGAVSVEEYIDNVKANIEAFARSGVIYERQELVNHINQAFTSHGSFAFLLGGMSAGKSTILKSLTKAANHNQVPELLVLYVDGRYYPGRLHVGLANGVAQIAAEKLLRKPGEVCWVTELKAAIHLLGRDAAIKDVESTFLIQTDDDDDDDGKKSDIRHILEIIATFMLASNSDDGGSFEVCKILIDTFIDMAENRNTFPVLVIDEANAVLGIQTIHDGQSSSSSSQLLTKYLLTSVVSYTKQDGRMNVILASTEHAFPYRLQRHHGLNLLNVDMMIYAGEIPPREMWKLLVSATYDDDDNDDNEDQGVNNRNKTIIGMGPNLAELCLAAYGGHFWTIRRAIRELSLRQDQAQASVSIPHLSPNIIKCLETETTTASRPLLQAMAQYGFAALYSPDNPAAELIAKEYVGGVVTINSARIIPSSQCARLRIAQVLLSRQGFLKSRHLLGGY